MKPLRKIDDRIEFVSWDDAKLELRDILEGVALVVIMFAVGTGVLLWPHH